MNFENLTDEQLAKHVNAGIAELKARTKRQAEEMAERHKRLLLDATSQDSSKEAARTKAERGS